MAGTFQENPPASVELAHYWTGGDGGAALSSLVDGFQQRHGDITLEDTGYDNHRLQVKSRILKEEPPDAWGGWPGGELRGYVDANTARDITDLWDDTDLQRQIRPFVADAVRVDDRYYAIPLSVHRVNDLYLHTETVERTGVDPSTASDPDEFVEVLSQAADDDVAGILLPMSDPFVVLQLWEVILLGSADERTFDDVVSGNAAANRDAIRSALENVSRLAALAPDDSLYHSLTDANERFVDGKGLAYPQGDWTGGLFSETEDFRYGDDWDRVPFPGTENQYDLVLDAVIPSVTAEGDGVDAFLEYVGSPDGQERFNRLKGSIPPRKDVDMDSFSEFGRDQARMLDRSTAQPRSVAHGLSVTPAQLVDLKSVVAEFVDAWDVDAATEEFVQVFESTR